MIHVLSVVPCRVNCIKLSTCIHVHMNFCTSCLQVHFKNGMLFHPHRFAVARYIYIYVMYLTVFFVTFQALVQLLWSDRSYTGNAFCDTEF